VGAAEREALDGRADENGLRNLYNGIIGRAGGAGRSFVAGADAISLPVSALRTYTVYVVPAWRLSPSGFSSVISLSSVVPVCQFVPSRLYSYILVSSPPVTGLVTVMLFVVVVAAISFASIAVCSVPFTSTATVFAALAGCAGVSPSAATAA
jgi:hypothetical protein